MSTEWGRRFAEGAFEIIVEIIYALSGLTGACLLCMWLYATSGLTSAPPLRPFMVLLGIFCGYVGGMITLGQFVSGGGQRLLGYASLIFSVICANAIANLLVPPYVVPPMPDPATAEATRAFFEASAFSHATPRLLVVECDLALIASPPFIIRRWNQRKQFYRWWWELRYGKRDEWPDD